MDLVNGLAARGHDLHVVVRPNSPIIEKLVVPADAIVTLPLRNALDTRSATALAKFVNGKQIDMVHAHMARDYPLSAYALRKNPTARLIVTRHVLFPLSKLHKITLAHVSQLIAVSHAVAREINKQALLPPAKVTVIHNGIDWRRIETASATFNRAEFCRKWKLPLEGLLVGSVGTLTPLKGHEDFLKAAVQIKAQVPGAVFIVSGTESAGSKTHRRELERLAKRLGLGDRVRFIGWMEDINELFCALDVFVSASHSESFGLAIVEAMAAGAGVVATATEGAREILQDEQTGLLVPVEGIEQLATAVVKLLSDEEKRAGLIDKARADVKSRFSLERMVEETERIYLRVLGT